MAFATLDDVEGQVETLILGKAYARSVEFLAVDSVLIVRGRLDHQERGQTKLIAQEVEPFEPTEDEVARARSAKALEPIVLEIDAAAFGASLVDELKDVFENFPGEAEVLLEMETREGTQAAPLRRRLPGQALRCAPRRARRPARHRRPGRLTRRVSTAAAALQGPIFETPDWALVGVVDSRVCRPGRERRGPQRSRRMPSVPRLLRQAGRARGCIEMGCRYLYSYEDIATGQRFMGCLNKVFSAEIDLDMFLLAERAGGFGGIKMTGEPLPQCQFTVEKAYEGDGPAYECVNTASSTAPGRRSRPSTSATR